MFICLFQFLAKMAEGNGEIIEEMATTNKADGNGESERTADYPKLVEYGLDKRVSSSGPIVFICIFLCKLYFEEFCNCYRDELCWFQVTHPYSCVIIVAMCCYRWQAN